MAHRSRPRAGFTIADLLAVIMLLSLLAGVGVQTIQQEWERSNRIQCSSNLRQIGQAMRQYAIDDTRGGNYPRTYYVTGTPAEDYPGPRFGSPYEGRDIGPHAEANPFITPQVVERRPELKELAEYAPEANDITGAMFHLLRVTDLRPAVFICPATQRKPLAFAEGHNKMSYTNWPGHAALRDHLSFSFHNMYPAPHAIGRGARWTDALSPTFVIGADMNPGTDAVLGVTPADVPQRDAPEAFTTQHAYNSPNHFGYGQNVLYADGAVRFAHSPLVGPGGDNVYTHRGPEPAEQRTPPREQPSAGIVGSPADAMDSVLLPTASLLEQPAPTVPTAAEMQEALRQRQQGEADR